MRKTLRNSLFKITALAISVASPILCQPAFAINISTDFPAGESFDFMGPSATATLPTDWRVDKSATVRTLGTYSAALTATELVAGNNMGIAAGGIYNFGAGPAASATDRAVGFLTSTSPIKTGNLYVKLTNVGASTINSLVVFYNVEKYRMGANPAGYSVQLYYSTDGSTWVSAGAGSLTSFPADASNAGYTSAPGVTNQAGGILPLSAQGASVPTGGAIYLAWSCSLASGTAVSSSAQALAIDDVTIYGTACSFSSVQVSGDAQICAGDSATVSAALSGIQPFNVMWSDGHVDSNVNATLINRTVAPAATTTYTVTNLTDATGCPGSKTGSATIAVNPLLNVTIVPATTNAECGATITFTANSTNIGQVAYQWYDNQTNAIPGETNITLTLTNVHSAVAGNYTIVVAGTSCEASAVGSLAVVDSLAPAITVNGANPSTNECHVAYADVGASAFDACSGGVAVFAVGSVNTNVPGVYSITYTADDGSGNTNTATRTVYVVDSLSPVVSILGANPYTNLLQSPFNDPGAVVTDVCDPVALIVTNNPVNINVPGSYQVTYVGSDSSGNATTNTRIVEVVAPPLPVLLSGFLTNGGFSVQFSGSVDQTYRVVATTNLAIPMSNWTILQTGIFGLFPASYLHTNLNDSAQYYRIGSP